MIACCGVCLPPSHRVEEERRHRLLHMKMSYQPGMWNVNTVTMGGLASTSDVVTGLLEIGIICTVL